MTTAMPIVGEIEGRKLEKRKIMETSMWFCSQKVFLMKLNIPNRRLEQPV